MAKKNTSKPCLKKMNLTQLSALLELRLADLNKAEDARNRGNIKRRIASIENWIKIKSNLS